MGLCQDPRVWLRSELIERRERAWERDRQKTETETETERSSGGRNPVRSFDPQKSFHLDCSPSLPFPLRTLPLLVTWCDFQVTTCQFQPPGNSDLLCTGSADNLYFCIPLPPCPTGWALHLASSAVLCSMHASRQSNCHLVLMTPSLPLSLPDLLLLARRVRVWKALKGDCIAQLPGHEDSAFPPPPPLPSSSSSFSS
eukprot:2455468-Rhodomonas_salina.2